MQSAGGAARTNLCVYISMAAASDLEPFIGKAHNIEHDTHKNNNNGGPKLAGLWPELKNQFLVHLSKELAKIGFAIQNGRNRLQQKTPRAVVSTFKNKHFFFSGTPFVSLVHKKWFSGSHRPATADGNFGLDAGKYTPKSTVVQTYTIICAYFCGACIP